MLNLTLSYVRVEMNIRCVPQSLSTLFFSLLNVYLFLFYVYECFARMYVCLVPAEARRGYRILWNQCCRLLRAALWVLGTRGPSVSVCPALELQTDSTMFSLYVHAEQLNFSFHTCTASTLPIEPSSSPLNLGFSFLWCNPKHTEDRSDFALSKVLSSQKS